MSEFKFACPVCGQHMMCDASQGGAVMDCPTCFQKIVAPQAPAADVKFILTGTVLTEKRISAPVAGGPAVVEKKFPAGLVLGLLLAALGAGAAGYFVYSKNHPSAPPPVVHKTNAAPAKAVVVAPPASDANWSLNLGTNAIPGPAAAGRIHGQDFIVERARFVNGTLALRATTPPGAPEFGCFISFGGAAAESLAGQTINVEADADRAAKVSLRWKDAADAAQKVEFTNGYAMRLEFGALANNRLPGKIWLCAPDAEKSYLLGTFNADARKPKPKTPKK